MGRPLFSAPREPAVAVAVRVEPEPEPEPGHPPLRRWTYWDAFDPDSDEFFEGDDAVYEAFIGPAARVQLPPDPAPAGARSSPSLSSPSASSSSSSASPSSSGRGSPMEGVDETETDIDEERSAVAVPAIRRAPVVRQGPEPVPEQEQEQEVQRGAVAQGRPAYFLTALDRVERPSARREPLPLPTLAETRPVGRERVPTYLEWPSEEEEGEGEGDTSRPRAPFRAPPTVRSTQTAALYVPRTYRPPPGAAYPGPGIPGSPLTNIGARLSVAHIAPAPTLVPVHRAA